MKIPSTRVLFFLALAAITLGLVGPAQGQNRSSETNEFWGDAYRPVPNRFPTIGHRSPAGGPKTTLERLRYWNSIAIDASGLDHTPIAPGENRVFGEQLGPARASRAEAIVHIAIFDAV